jgi:hypothetical protein
MFDHHHLELPRRRIKVADQTRRARTKTGRPKGSKGLHFLQVDVQLLHLVENLRAHWFERTRPLPDGTRPVPSQHAAITKIVKLSLDPTVVPLLGFKPNAYLGASERAIVTRLRARISPPLHPHWTKQRRKPRSKPRPLVSRDLAFENLKPGGQAVSKYSPPPALWQFLHQKCPYLRLLPDK